MNENGSGSPLDAVVTHAEAAKKKLQEQRLPLVEQLASIDAQVRALDRVIRAAKPQTKAKKKTAPASPPKVARDKIERMIAAMRADPERAWAATDFAEEVGMHRSAAQAAIKYLRDMEVIRKVGVRPVDGDGRVRQGVPPAIYRLMPNWVDSKEALPHAVA